ncbi:MAG TPA: RNA polymerase sigma factor [Thermoanaerobaculia bacterium]|nr:RNA polymerase sigma factor [Thermoanaerobaculia bacterium]
MKKPVMNQPLANEELMDRVREGACEFLGVLFDRHHVALFNFFCRLTNDRAASEDLVQETFYRMLKYHRSYKSGSCFEAWMYQIARNARTESFLKRRGEVELESAPMAVVLPIDSANDHQQMSLLKKALSRLPEEKRELLVLSRFQGLKCEEIAAVLHCTAATVRVRVHRALQELKENYRCLEGQRRVKWGGMER